MMSKHVTQYCSGHDVYNACSQLHHCRHVRCQCKFVCCASSGYFKVTERCWLLGSCPGFDFLQVNMVGHSRKMASDEVVMYKPLQENEYSDIYENIYSSGNEIN
jgi:hypothetical protein